MPATPAATRFPAEWEPHGATWLAYPHLATDWPGKLTAARLAFVEFVRKLVEHETVRLLVRTDAEAKRAQSTLKRGGVNLDDLDFRFCATDRSWLRDSGQRDRHNPDDGAELALPQATRSGSNSCAA